MEENNLRSFTLDASAEACYTLHTCSTNEMAPFFKRKDAQQQHPVGIILSRGATMEQAATPPEETWQLVICRLCTHRFEVLITCPEDTQIALCQFCTLLVEWFGQPEEAPSLVPPAPVPGHAHRLEAGGTGEPPTCSPDILPGSVPPDEAPGLQIAPQPEHAAKVSKKVRQREQLAGLLDQWGELWRSSEEE
jgi:hypothetical protein